MKPRWIQFELCEPGFGLETDRWNVLATSGRILLGTIHWFGRWRKYAFYPSANSVFEQDCLRDIADFCQEQTKLYRAENWGPKSQ